MHSFTIASVLAVSACASDDSAQEIETLTIEAMRETVPVISPGDAADDPAVWRNPADPTKSLIVGTDKEWGLNVYDLSGALLSSAPAGLVNNVDLRADVRIEGHRGVLVAASDRTEDPNGRIALYELETATGRLRHIAHAPVASDGVGEVYGFCLWRRADDQVFAFIPFNNGDVRQYALDLSGPAPAARLVRDVKLDSQTEGCVADDRTGLVYVGEEDVGVWRMGAAPDSKDKPVQFATVDGVRLIPDIEGLAIMPEGERGGFLIASAQADTGRATDRSAYAVYDLETGRLAAHFRIADSATIDGVTDTDGLEFATGNFGAPFEQGIFIVQDGDNTPGNQNFKLVPGSAVRRLVGLE
jgi:3-phytase